MNHPKFVLILNTPHTVLLHRGKICMCFVFNMKSVLLARLTEVLNFHLSSLKVILHLLVCYELCNGTRSQLHTRLVGSRGQKSTRISQIYIFRHSQYHVVCKYAAWGTYVHT